MPWVLHALCLYSGTIIPFFFFFLSSPHCLPPSISLVPSGTIGSTVTVRWVWDSLHTNDFEEMGFWMSHPQYNCFLNSQSPSHEEQDHLLKLIPLDLIQGFLIFIWSHRMCHICHPLQETHLFLSRLFSFCKSSLYNSELAAAPHDIHCISELVWYPTMERENRPLLTHNWASHYIIEAETINILVLFLISAVKRHA